MPAHGSDWGSSSVGGSSTSQELSAQRLDPDFAAAPPPSDAVETTAHVFPSNLDNGPETRNILYYHIDDPTDTLIPGSVKSVNLSMAHYQGLSSAKKVLACDEEQAAARWARMEQERVDSYQAWTAEAVADCARGARLERYLNSRFDFRKKVEKTIEARKTCMWRRDLPADDRDWKDIRVDHQTTITDLQSMKNKIDPEGLAGLLVVPRSPSSWTSAVKSTLKGGRSRSASKAPLERSKCKSFIPSIHTANPAVLADLERQIARLHRHKLTASASASTELASGSDQGRSHALGLGSSDPSPQTESSKSKGFTKGKGKAVAGAGDDPEPYSHIGIMDVDQHTLMS